MFRINNYSNKNQPTIKGWAASKSSRGMMDYRIKHKGEADTDGIFRNSLASVPDGMAEFKLLI
jgi:hypothetical protein